MTSYSAPAPMGPPPTANSWRPPALDRAPAHRGYESKPTNLMAILSLMAAASAWVLTGPLGTIAAVVLGFVALKQIKQRDEGGRELVIMALVAAGVSVVLGTLLLISGIAMLSAL
ncbi:DUF4190 domain-containing protein [Agrococcus casei]|uniref:DUF4190 domain-containing protein n=1 Tax=Agrococcus casei TaxID=343512 RepID=UPI003F93F6BA